VANFITNTVPDFFANTVWDKGLRVFFVDWIWHGFLEGGWDYPREQGTIGATGSILMFFRGPANPLLYVVGGLIWLLNWSRNRNPIIIAEAPGVN